MNNVETICPECKRILYSNKDGNIISQQHLPRCSKYFQKGAYFEVGDRVRRRKEHMPNWWLYADKIFTVTWVGTKSPEFFMVEREELVEGAVNMFDYKQFEKVNEE